MKRILTTAALLPICALCCAATPSVTDVRVSEEKCRALVASQTNRSAAVPDDVGSLMREGVRLGCIGRRSQSLAMFQRVVAIDPSAAGAYNNIAALLAAEGRIDEARAALERALQTNEVYAAAHDNLGAIYLHLSAEAYRKAIGPDRAAKPAPPVLSMVLAPESQSTGVRTPASTPASASAPASAPAPASAQVSAPAPASIPALARAPASVNVPSGDQAAAAAPMPRTQEGDARAADAVRAAIEAWASAWSRREMTDYVAAYAPDFKGRAPSRDVWLRERTQRIVPRASVEVTLSNLTVSVEGDVARAGFLQHYVSAGIDVRSRKSLELRRVAGRWLIAAETSR